jgi:serine/threonine protein kinase
MNITKFKKIPKLNELIFNEIQILSKINCPNIIRFIEILRTSNNYYLIYEFCNGGTLEEIIKEKKYIPE